MRTRKNKKIIGGGDTIKSIKKLVKYLERIIYSNSRYTPYNDESRELYKKLSQIIDDNNDLLRSAKNINSFFITFIFKEIGLICTAKKYIKQSFLSNTKSIFFMISTLKAVSISIK